MDSSGAELSCIEVKVSILMATYAAETAVNLEASLGSLIAQTRPPDEIVLVLDGPVDREQDAVIDLFATSAPVPTFRVVRLPQRSGLAAALNAGLEVCTGDIVMRMDSDDLCLPDRIAVELDYLMAHRNIDIVTSWVEEFFDDGSPAQLKVSPTNQEALVQALRWRNVIAHPSVAIRPQVLKKVGGYSSRFPLLEDYDLWVRLCLAGAQFHVLPKVLVRMRSSTAQRRRRGGLRYCLNEIVFRVHLFRLGFLNLRELIVTTSLYVIFRLVSATLRGRLYSLVRTAAKPERSAHVQ